MPWRSSSTNKDRSGIDPARVIQPIDPSTLSNFQDNRPVQPVQSSLPDLWQAIHSGFLPAPRSGTRATHRASGLTVILNALPLNFDGRIVLVEPKINPSESPPAIPSPAEDSQ
jgi:hypothetical protein